MAIDASFYTKKRSTSVILSVGFLILVVVATGALYWYNMYLARAVEEKQNTVKHYEASISELKEDKNIQIYDLVKMNQVALKALSERSNMKKHILYLKQLGSQFQIQFEWFVYSDGTISTQWKIATTENGDRAYAKFVNFLSKYRQEESRKFDILFVNSISGHDNMQIDFKFKLK